MKFFIGGVEIRPKNASQIGIKLDFTGDAQDAELTTDSLILTNEAYKIVKASIAEMGLFEGVLLTVTIGTLSLEYFIDLTQNKPFKDTYMECGIRKRHATDWFMQRANGLSFTSLNKQTPITGSFDVPYIIVKDNQAELLLMLSLSTYTMTRELISTIRDIVDTTSSAIQAATPNVGVPPSMDTGDIIAMALKIAGQIIMIAALTIALVANIKQMIELIVPKIRYFKASKVKSLIAQGCAHFGYQFSSTLLDAVGGLTLLPVPMVDTNKSIWNVLLQIETSYYNRHFPSAMDTVPTLGQLIEEAKKWCNGKIRVIGNTVHLERRDYWYNLSSQSVINTLNIQSDRENSNTYNFDEAWKRYLLRYQYDISDTHTMDKVQGQIVEKSTELINSNNPDIHLVTGVATVDINFVPAYRKDKLNKVEEALLEFAIQVDSLISFLGGDESFADKVTDRLGVMQISQQHFSTTKLMYTVGGKQPANYLDYIGAGAVYNNYHAINQVKENLKSISNSQIPFSESQLLALMNNNVVFDINGNQLEILTFDYISENSEANIMYSEKSDKGFNLQTVTIA